MTQTLDAVFEDGSFKPLNNDSLPFAEGQRVRLTVEIPDEKKDDLIELAAHVYDGLTEAEVNDVESLALDRSGFFEGVAEALRRDAEIDADSAQAISLAELDSRIRVKLG